MKWRGLAAVGLVFAAGQGWAALPSPAGRFSEQCVLVFDNGTRLDAVPHARTIEEQAQGLAGLTDVGPGLLFSWRLAAPLVFWMHDTPAALTVGFFDADGVLFQVEDMEPFTDDRHYSRKAARYALELSRGSFARLGLTVGSRLVRTECSPSP